MNKGKCKRCNTQTNSLSSHKGSKLCEAVYRINLLAAENYVRLDIGEIRGYDLKRKFDWVKEEPTALKKGDRRKRQTCKLYTEYWIPRDKRDLLDTVHREVRKSFGARDDWDEGRDLQGFFDLKEYKFKEQPFIQYRKKISQTVVQEFAKRLTEKNNDRPTPDACSDPAV